MRSGSCESRSSHCGVNREALHEDDLILYYYGERRPRAPTSSVHLDQCESLRRRLSRAGRDAAGSSRRPKRRSAAISTASRSGSAFVTAAGAGSPVVERVVQSGSAGDRPERSPCCCWPRSSPAGGGRAPRRWRRRRQSRPRHAGAPPAASSDEARQRILLTSVADHLDRSERVLTDIMNAPAGGDISAEQRWAEDLVADEPSLSPGCGRCRRTLGRRRARRARTQPARDRPQPSRATAADLEAHPPPDRRGVAALQSARARRRAAAARAAGPRRAPARVPHKSAKRIQGP